MFVFKNVVQVYQLVLRASRGLVELKTTALRARTIYKRELIIKLRFVYFDRQEVVQIEFPSMSRRTSVLSKTTAAAVFVFRLSIINCYRPNLITRVKFHTGPPSTYGHRTAAQVYMVRVSRVCFSRDYTRA